MEYYRYLPIFLLFNIINIFSISELDIINDRLQVVEIKLAMQEMRLSSNKDQNSKNNELGSSPIVVEPSSRHDSSKKPSQVVFSKFPQEFPKAFLTALSYLEDPRPFHLAKARIPNKFLLYGPPGCGKSYLAELIAQEFQLPLIYLKASDLEDKYYGESSRKITDIFNMRDPNGRPLLLFIDEIDAIGLQRRDNTSEAVRATINSLLIELQKHSFDSSIFIILATNNKGILDPALLNRLEGLCIEIQPMNQRDRELFLNDILRNIPVKNKNEAILALSKEIKGLSRRAVSTAIESAYAWIISRQQFEVTLEELLTFIKQAKKDKQIPWLAQCQKFINSTAHNINYTHALLGTALISVQLLTHPLIAEKLNNVVFRLTNAI